jgi:hypothetical protein
MNLNQITARIGELSAELLTLHNDLAFIVAGEVTRTQAKHSGVVRWQDLKEGDTIHVQTEFKAHGGRLVEPGIYTISDIEDPCEYFDDLPFAIRGNGLDGHWIYCEEPDADNDYAGRGNTGTNAYGLFRKVS